MGKLQELTGAPFRCVHYLETSAFRHNADASAAEEYQIIFLYDGILHTAVGQQRFTLKSQDMLLVPQEMDYQFMSGTGMANFYCLSFSADLLDGKDRELLDNFELKQESDKRLYSNTFKYGYKMFFDPLFICGNMPEAFQNEVVMQLFVALLRQINNMKKMHSDVYINERVAGIVPDILNFIHLNFAQINSLDDVVSHFYISSHYINQIFKAATGMTIMKYVNEQKIGHAKSLIENGGSLSEVAEQVGYANYSTFYRTYMRHFGEAPTLGKRKKEPTLKEEQEELK